MLISFWKYLIFRNLFTINITYYEYSFLGHVHGVHERKLYKFTRTEWRTKERLFCSFRQKRVESWYSNYSLVKYFVIIFWKK